VPELTYKNSGVDLDQYQQAMQKIPALLGRTHGAQKSRVMPLPGGFAGLFRLNDDSRRYRDPVLVSGTDGVGTKIKVALLAGRFETIGIDLVAMCQNDCLCLGAEPLFFLDYIALGKDNPQLVGELVKGVSNGCIAAGCALLGGETAIMPDLYSGDDFDMAGFAVGVVERDEIVDGSRIAAGDVVIGLASSGLHSNGYSLIRKVVFEAAGLDISANVSQLDCSVAEALLEPTRIYSAAVNSLLSDTGIRSGIHGMAHITGGGLAENIERILPDGSECSIELQRGTWNVPPVFDWLKSLGPVDDEEMYRVFNMGVGFALVVRPEVAAAIRSKMSDQDIPAWEIGTVAVGERRAVFVE
jgi:phosphoribosylformylglycinamidine cyclo-ligase